MEEDGAGRSTGKTVGDLSSRLPFGGGPSRIVSVRRHLPRCSLPSGVSPSVVSRTLSTPPPFDTRLPPSVSTTPPPVSPPVFVLPLAPFRRFPSSPFSHPPLASAISHYGPSSLRRPGLHVFGSYRVGTGRTGPDRVGGHCHVDGANPGWYSSQDGAPTPFYLPQVLFSRFFNKQNNSAGLTLPVPTVRPPRSRVFASPTVQTGVCVLVPGSRGPGSDPGPGRGSWTRTLPSLPTPVHERVTHRSWSSGASSEAKRPDR